MSRKVGCSVVESLGFNFICLQIEFFRNSLPHFDN